jgi:hypothetical protein
MKKRDKAKRAAIIISSIATQVHAADIIETAGGLNNLIYGIAAGLAALMITLHAIRWKTADNLSDREEAKKGMINVILALILLMIAGAAISAIYVKPPESEPATTTRIPTTRAPPTTAIVTTTIATTSTTTITTSTTTTTINPAKLLTATNLARCINRAGGKLISDPLRCHPCLHQKMAFVNDAADGQAAYDNLDKPHPSGGIPRWEWTSNGDFNRIVGCQSFYVLNGQYMFDCKLIPVPGHVYQTCF